MLSLCKKKKKSILILSKLRYKIVLVVNVFIISQFLHHGHCLPVFGLSSSTAVQAKCISLSCTALPAIELQWLPHLGMYGIRHFLLKLHVYVTEY